jgi:predicted DCC family thiol-disulfide oxidoreductase YuxK
MTPPTGSGIVVYDSDCGICNASREWAETRDWDRRLQFLPYQTADLETLSPGLDREMASRSAFFIYPGGRRVSGARAIFETLRRLPGVWGIIGLIMARPPFWLLAEPLYYLVARNRACISARLGLSYCLVDGKPVRQPQNQPPLQE